uniref:Kielin/chordin-like protein n=1 Tax=Scleropages formosus TaxID=113540 RepID=A0A8D0C9R4_SCLFO
MEIISLRTGLFLRCFVILFWSLHLSAEQGNLPDYNDNKNVIDLLKALNINHTIKGITKAQDSKDGFQVWNFHQKLPDLTLPQDVSTFLVDNTRGSLGFHFVAQQAKHTTGTLITLTSPANMKGASWPLLSVVSSRTSDQLRLHYRALSDMKPAYILFPDGTPFSSSHWAQLALSVEINKVVIFVDCREAIMLEKNPLLSLDLPADLQVTLGSTPGDQASKFVGSWQTAKISTVGYQKRPWVCPDAGLQQLTHLKSKAGLLTEGPHHGEMKLQPDLPYGQILERGRPTCIWEGRKVEEGTRWDMEQQGSCMCMNGTITCTPTGACSYEGTRYNNGEPFSPDTCSSCICENRCIQCHKVICPPQSCPNQYVPPGQCCPTCYPGCEYEETIYKNGDVFLSRSNPCMNCSCTDSVVRCIPVRCPPTKCHNPIQRPRECCPTCTDGCCLTCECGSYKQHNHSNENIFLKPNDPCETCISQVGTPQCPSRDTRPRPTPRPPRCIPSPSACCYKQHRYSNGQRFVDPDDSSKTCICQAGSVQCNRRESEPTSSPSPCPSPLHNPCPNPLHNPCPNPRPTASPSPCSTPPRNPSSSPCSNPPRNPSPNPCSTPPGNPSPSPCSTPPGNPSPNPCPTPSPNPCPTPPCNPSPNPCPTPSPNPCPTPPRNPSPNPCPTPPCNPSPNPCPTPSPNPCPTPPRNPSPNPCSTPPRNPSPSPCSTPPRNPSPNPCPTPPRNPSPNPCSTPPRNPSPNPCSTPPRNPSPNPCPTPSPNPCSTPPCNPSSSPCSTPPRNPSPNPCPTPSPNPCSTPPRNPSPNPCSTPPRNPSPSPCSTPPRNPCPTPSPNPCPTPPCNPSPNPCPTPSPNPCPTPPRNPSPNPCPTPSPNPCPTPPRNPCPTPSPNPCPTPSPNPCPTPPRNPCPNPCPTPSPNPCPTPPRNPCPNPCPTPSPNPCPTPPRNPCPTPPRNPCCNPSPNPCPTPSPNLCPTPSYNPSSIPCSLPGIPSPSACCYKQHRYSNGQRFVDPDDSSKTCICQAGAVQCTSTDCTQPPCPNPPTLPDDDCSTPDMVCLYKNLVYNNEETFMDPEDPCKICSCLDGRVLCALSFCPPVSCRNPYRPPGQCCPKCLGCLMDGEWHEEGTVWVKKGQPQVCCTCVHGESQCDPQHCHFSLIKKPCRGDDCSSENHMISGGKEFHSSSDSCQECVRLRKEVICQDQECPPPNCSNPRPGPCCRNDCNGCSFAGVEYQNGMQFLHPTDDCKTCHCNNGNVRCLRKRCPPLKCSKQNVVPGKCCPKCAGAKLPLMAKNWHVRSNLTVGTIHSAKEGATGCLFYNMTLAIQQSVRDPRNPCSECTCRDGHVLCAPVKCPEVQCQNPIIPPGECCPVCSKGCHFQGRVYKNGSAFQMPTKQHVQCSCLNGSVSCHRKQLSSTRSCSYMGAVYADRQVFRIRTPVASSCRDCSCLAGRVLCVDIPCPRLTCKDQVKDPGSCCPRCRGEMITLSLQYPADPTAHGVTENLMCSCPALPQTYTTEMPCNDPSLPVWE